MNLREIYLTVTSTAYEKHERRLDIAEDDFTTLEAVFR
jgi:hypothetical protein